MRLSRDESGFTLIELLVAAIVLVIAIAGTAAVFAASDTTTLDSELQQIGTAQAERVVEEIKSLEYDAIGHAEAPVEPAGEGRLDGAANTYQPPGTAAEQLVIAANDEGGDSTGGVLTAALQARPFEVDTDPAQLGNPPVTGTVYSFVTWRDEECELLDMTALDSALADLRADLQALVDNMNVLDQALKAVFGPSQRSLPDEVRDFYRFTFDGHRDQIEAAQGTIDDLTATAANADLCDLGEEALDAIQAMTDPDGAGGFEASAEILGVTAEVNASIDAVIVPSLSSLLCALLGTFCEDSDDLETTMAASGLSATMTGLEANADTVTAAITHETTHNTKRITVAVVVEPERSDITPHNVIYQSSVAIDPEDGLL